VEAIYTILPFFVLKLWWNKKSLGKTLKIV
jgi:hypothetical protein